MITANTFSSQRISQADYHLEEAAREMAYEGARLARIQADKYSTEDKPRFVVGTVGPTNKTCSMSPDVSNPATREITYDELFVDYCEQIDGLIEGGVDAIMMETIFDTLNAKAGIDAALTTMRKHGKDLPIMISLTVSDLAGRTLSGQTVEAFLASLSPYPIFSVGMNCAFGAPQMKPFIQKIGAIAPWYISAHPNAGLPNEMGEYDETPESMAPKIKEFIDEGLVNIIGGCCGTSPEFLSCSIFFLPFYLLSFGCEAVAGWVALEDGLSLLSAHPGVDALVSVTAVSAFGVLQSVSCSAHRLVIPLRLVCIRSMLNLCSG